MKTGFVSKLDTQIIEKGMRGCVPRIVAFRDNKEVLTLPRIKFKLASDADTRDIDCFAFERDCQGRPTCAALTHPYCLQAGAKPCSFCITREEYEAEQQRIKQIQIINLMEVRPWQSLNV